MFLACLRVFMPCMTISAFRSKFYKKNSISISQLENFTISIFTQIFLACRFEILIWKSKWLAFLYSVVYISEPWGWFIPCKSSHCLQLQKQLTTAPGRVLRNASLWKQGMSQPGPEAVLAHSSFRFHCRIGPFQMQLTIKSQPRGKQNKLLCIFQIVKSNSGPLNNGRKFCRTHPIWI